MDSKLTLKRHTLALATVCSLVTASALGNAHPAGAQSTAGIASPTTATASGAQENQPQSSILVGVGHDEAERRLSWFTNSGQAEVVQIAQGEHSELPASARTIIPSVQASSAEPGHEYVHATLDNLSPGSYSYRVGSETGGWSQVQKFQVFPSTLHHQFTFVGDPQLGASKNLESDTAGWLRALDAKDRLFPESQFVLSAGDQVETYAGDVEEYRNYLAPEQMRTQTHAQTLGNHDYNRVAPQALYA